MATPRKRWYRAADALGFETLSNDELATWHRVLSLLNSRARRDGRTAEEACEVRVPPAELARLAGCESRVRALRTFGGLVARGWCTLSPLDARGERTDDPRCPYYRLEVPNFSDFQTSRSDGRADGGPDPGAKVPLPTPTPTPISSSLRSEEKEPAAPPLGTDLLGEPLKPRTRDFRAAARAAWPAAVAAAARHGKRWQTLNDSRLTALAARMREYPDIPDLAVRLVDGAVAYWRKSKPKDSDLTADLDPSTVFRASKAAKYLEHYDASAVNGAAHAPASIDEAKRILAEQRARDADLYA